MKKGTRVEILIEAGLMEQPDDTRFCGKCDPGTIGTYEGPHPNKKLKSWHLVRVSEFRIAPLGESHFRAVQ